MVRSRPVPELHTRFNGTLFLGSSVDKEQDGQPNSTATGDGADEDGVVFLTSFEADPTRNLPAYVDVTSKVPVKWTLCWISIGTVSLTMRQSIWVWHQFQRDAGHQSTVLTIPAGKSVGSSMLRVRLSSVGLLQRQAGLMTEKSKTTLCRSRLFRLQRLRRLLDRSISTWRTGGSLRRAI